MVGYYAVADKVVRGVTTMMGPVSDAVYPRLTRMRELSPKNAEVNFSTYAIMTISGGMLLTLGLLIMAPALASILLDSKRRFGLPIIRILAVLPFSSTLTNVFGLQYLIPQGVDRPFTAVVAVSGVAGIVITFLVAPYYGAAGAAVVTVGIDAAGGAVLYSIYCLMHNKIDTLASSTVST
jgi:PST family polysaccharide transporter